MERIGARIEERRELLSRAEERLDPRAIAHERSLLLVLDERLTELWWEMNYCVADIPVPAERRDHVVQGPSCTGTELLDALEFNTYGG